MQNLQMNETHKHVSLGLRLNNWTINKFYFVDNVHEHLVKNSLEDIPGHQTKRI